MCGVFMIVFWVLVIYGLVLVVRSLSARGRSGGTAPHEEPPLEILRRRYAKGEIGKTEFEEKKKDLAD